jgi:hypothetical protein
VGVHGPLFEAEAHEVIVTGGTAGATGGGVCSVIAAVVAAAVVAASELPSLEQPATTTAVVATMMARPRVRIGRESSVRGNLHP